MLVVCGSFLYFVAGVAEAFVCLWKRPHMLARVNSNTVPKLVSAVLDLLDTDRLPQTPGETSVVRTYPPFVPRCLTRQAPHLEALGALVQRLEPCHGRNTRRVLVFERAGMSP